jgi:two-component system sensor histidine kinase SenX3
MWRVPKRLRDAAATIPISHRSTPATAPTEIPAPGVSERPVESESALRALLDALPVGVVAADATGRVILRNRMAEHAAGARHGDILVEEAVEVHLRAAARGEERRQTLDLYGPPSRVLTIHARPVEGGGAIATISDVTERARLDAVRTDFVANISHELKTPVGAISILAETLVDADDPAVTERLAGKIVKESTRLANTIDDLLELSRIELGNETQKEPVSVSFVVAEATDRARSLAERREIRLDVHEPAEPVTVLGDARQLVSAVGNLVDNAVKYSEPGGAVEVDVDTDGLVVTFRVTDHGIGIPPRHLDRIFERFYRVDRARSRETGGTGLGLSIVRHVAANHGGEVAVTSQEGEGSTFMLKIPAAPAAEGRVRSST